MQVDWQQGKTGMVAVINGIPVAQAAVSEFGAWFTVTLLLPYTGEQRRFNTLHDAGVYIAVQVETIIKILSK